MSSVTVCDHCGKQIGSESTPRVRLSVEPRGYNSLGTKGMTLTARAKRVEQEAAAHATGRSFDLHQECFDDHIRPHLVAAGLGI